MAAVPPPPGYWARVRDICDRWGVLLILDEVMAGMGRTGRWYACRHYDLLPDILTLGKGVSGGTLALSACATLERHFQGLRTGGGFVHGGTYSHHPVAAAAGLAAVGIIEREGLVQRVDEMGRVLGGMLAQRLLKHKNVVDVRGIGFLWGVELAQDKATLTPFLRKEQVTERLWKELFKNGLITYKAVGLAGPDGDALVVAPPFVATEGDLEYIVATMEQGLAAVLG
ncbi:MAG: hypothetical protein C0405_14075 [Desulfovibrio sp.]|nr:hypothetical protein [Desulfovibrio sp.]